MVLHKKNHRDWYQLISHHKMLFYHWKPSVQTRDWYSYGHRPNSILGITMCPKVPGTSRFIDDLCTINDDDKFSSYKCVHPKQSELKLEHQGKLAAFLDLDRTVDDNIFVYKFWHKGQVSFLYCTYALSVKPYSIIVSIL